MSNSLVCGKCDNCPRTRNLQQCADLALSIITATTSVVTYIFHVVNNGPLAASTVILTVDFTGTSPTFSAGWTVVGSVATFDFGVLPVGAAPTLPTISFALGASSVSGIVLATATPECYLPNNSATAVSLG